MSDIPYVRSCLATVQVSVADQRLRVFDSAQRRWRHVCSSGANQLLAAISCEEMGFVRWPEEKTLREQIERKNDVAENGQKNHLWVVVFFFFFRAINFSVTCAPDSSSSGHEFFCVKESELTYGKKIGTALYPWWGCTRAGRCDRDIDIAISSTTIQFDELSHMFWVILFYCIIFIWYFLILQRIVTD